MDVSRFTDLNKFGSVTKPGLKTVVKKSVSETEEMADSVTISRADETKEETLKPQTLRSESKSVQSPSPQREEKPGDALSWDDGNFPSLGREAPSTKVAESDLSTWLKARSRPVFTTEALDQVVEEMKPLVKDLSGKPDPAKWNEPTWKAFQAASYLPSKELLTAAEAVETDGKKGGILSPLLAANLAQPGVNRETLASLMRVRAFASEIVKAELPSLLQQQRNPYLGMVHDTGYATGQLQRTRDPSSILCPTEQQGVLDSERLALLPDNVADRFSDQSRVAASFGDGAKQVFPKLNLGHFFTDESKDADSAQKALTFLEKSGKDVYAASSDLGGQSMQGFLQRVPGEERRDWLDRIGGKQVLNPLANEWKTLEREVGRLHDLGGDGKAMGKFLEDKQTAALAPALLVLNAPSLFGPAYRGASSEIEESMDGMMQVFWRATSPHLDFKDPLVSCGQSELAETHGEQIRKDRELWTNVVGLQKTRIVSGLRDDTYDDRMSSFLRKSGVMELPSDRLSEAVGRLERDLGPNNPVVQKTVADLNLEDGDPQLVTDLHALRFDPSVFTVDVPGKVESLKFGGQTFGFECKDGKLTPEFVGATTVAYRVQVGGQDGRSAILRLPKGATPRIDREGNLKMAVFDEERHGEVSARLRDFEVFDSRIRLTNRQVLKEKDHIAVLEERPRTENAAQSLKAGAALGKKDVDMLLDQWVAGLAERDASTHPKGVFYELGPDNYILEPDGLVGSYVDVSLPFRNERDRESFGFFKGGYGSAANWIVADNTPLKPERVSAVWKGEGLDGGAANRRQLFLNALGERLDDKHPMWQTLPQDKVAQTLASLRRDAEAIGLPAGGLDTQTAWFIP
jgi:hypothetical protein